MSKRYYLAQKDITGAEIFHLSCPIARCLRRHGFPNASVGSMSVRPYGLLRESFTLSRKLRDFIRRHDQGFTVKPMHFTVPFAPEN